ncbi:MAG: recombinase family protein [Candidatus Acidiferrales bacterium]
MRAAIYARVSTNDCKCSACAHKWTPRTSNETAQCPKCGSTSQIKRQSVDMQVRELRQFAEARGWQIAAEYLDEGVSGAKDSRPELDRLMADAHRRRFDVVIVWKFDRFARSVSHLLRALETFSALGVGFVSLSESLDTSTPAGKMVFTVLGAVAELERSLIAERVRAGLRNARAKGKTLGRPRVVVDARQIAALRAERLSWAAIAERLGIGEGTVYRAAQASAKNLSRQVAASASKLAAD